MSRLVSRNDELAGLNKKLESIIGTIDSQCVACVFKPR